MTTLPPEPRRRPKRRKEPERMAVPVDDACTITGLGRTSIYELIAAGKLKSVAIGRRRLVLYSSIEALLQPEAGFVSPADNDRRALDLDDAGTFPARAGEAASV